MATGVWHVKHVGCCLNVTAVRPREFAAEDPKLPASDSGGTAAKDARQPIRRADRSLADQAA